jgi:hypothetical protein
LIELLDERYALLIITPIASTVLSSSADFLAKVDRKRRAQAIGFAGHVVLLYLNRAIGFTISRTELLGAISYFRRVSSKS